MTIYEAETHVTYRGFLISVTVKCERGRHGRKRTTRASVLGFLPNALSGEYSDSHRYTRELHGNEVEYISNQAIDFSGRSYNKTYIDDYDQNWPQTRHPIVKIIRNLRTPPKPTPLSEQVEECLNETQNDIDQFLQDRSIDFDEREFEHGLTSALAEPVDDISVDISQPTKQYENDTFDSTEVVETLAKESTKESSLADE